MLFSAFLWCAGPREAKTWRNVLWPLRPAALRHERRGRGGAGGLSSSSRAKYKHKWEQGESEENACNRGLGLEPVLLAEVACDCVIFREKQGWTKAC